MGMNEVNADSSLKRLIRHTCHSHAGVTIQDIAETRGIPDKAERLKLLEERKNGYLKRAELRRKIKELKGGGCTENGTVASPSDDSPFEVDRVLLYPFHRMG
jgi:hypothetical protein